MLRRVGELTVRRRRWILVGALVAFVAAGAFGGRVAKSLSSGGFDDPGSESSRAVTALQQQFDTGDPNFVLLVRAGHGTVDSPAVRAEGLRLTSQLARERGVEAVVSYWSLRDAPPLRSRNSSEGLVLARIEGSDDTVRDRVETLAPRYTLTTPDVTVGIGGRAEVFHQVSTQVESDLQKAERISIPITLVLLILVFGSVVAAGLPLMIGGFAIVGTFVALRVLSSLTDVSIFSLNLTTAMSLGLGIDYALFIVSRYREEVRRGLAPHDAVVRSVETAGRTVLFSALTVGVSMAALMVFPLYFLRSFAYAGIAVVTLAAFGAVIILPALIAVLGRRVDSLVLWRRKPKPEGTGFWHRLATVVMRRPGFIAVGIVAVLLVLGAPFLKVNFGLPDDRVLPTSASSRVVQDQIRTQFTSQEVNTMPVVAPDTGGATPTAGQITSYASRLSRIPGVGRVDALTGSFEKGRLMFGPNRGSARFRAPHATWLSVVPSVEPMSDAGEALVHDLRATPAPFDVLVGGDAARLVDSKHALFDRVPLALGLIGLVTFVVLFLFTGSLFVPVKAVVLNLLSLTATFGAMVWVFQEGHLSGLLNFTPTGLIDTTTPITMFCIAFGLSMDYEVFLLSRIREEWLRTGDNVRSVALGLERTGPLVTAAAATLALVFIAFATSQVTFIKLLGVGLALAVIMDATLIRGTLVPAFMRLAGRANWWAPRWLRRVHDRIGLREAPAAAPPVADGAVGPGPEPTPVRELAS
ncbi:MAG: MMPL family transporter [Actinomycetota bacterium]